MNKSLWCTCFKQFLNNRLFIHNMLHHIVILQVEPCCLFRSSKAMNKPLWCTCFKQILKNRLFIHNMLHHIVILRVEPCCFFLLSPSFRIFIFEKKTALQRKAIKTLRLKIWPQILRISTSAEFQVKIQLNPINSNTGLLKSTFYFLKLFFLPYLTFLNRYFSLKTTR